MLGFDFGTTNSSVARFDEDGNIDLLQVPAKGGVTASYRSILFLAQEKLGARTQVRSFTGPSAIEHYLAAEHKGRLIQSLKSYLPSRSLVSTEVYGRRYKLEDLIARILSDIRIHAERQFGQPVRSALVGRPVRFVGAESEEDDAFAVSRLRAALHLAGFESVDFELEPVAAAYHYECTLDHDELILIGDFGGGTSDFSLLHVGPSVRGRGRAEKDLLGNGGLGLAGDTFDARIVRRLVSPHLGADTLERSLDKTLTAVPQWIYTRLEHWHHLSFLQTRPVIELLKGARVRAFEPEKIQALLDVIEEDLGYQLHQAVQRLKIDLSTTTEAEFRFTDGSVDIRARVTRDDFEGWIREDLLAIEGCVDDLLRSSGMDRRDVDRVFLTGGSSLVPAVRRIFSSRFGEDKVRTGGEFTSVARGLALRAGELSSLAIV
ncbi:MAG: Hsp70 family protein [Acidobacteriaceae bacterium]